MSTGPSYVPDPSFTMFSGGPEPCRGAIGCSHKHGIVGSGTGHCCSLCTAQAGHQTDQCCSGSTACTDCIRSHCRSPCKDRRSQTTAAWQSTEISWSYWVPRILGASKIDSAAARQVSNPLHARRRSAELCSGGTANQNLQQLKRIPKEHQPLPLLGHLVKLRLDSVIKDGKMACPLCSNASASYWHSVGP